MVWMVVFVASCVFSGLLASLVEDLVDELIYEVNQELLDNHQDVLAIPAIEEKLEKQIFGFKFRLGEFRGEGGWFKNASTIRRTGPLEAKLGITSLTLGASLGLEDVEFGFEHYHIKMFNVRLHGKLRASVGKNSIHAHLTMAVSDLGSCQTIVNKLEVESFEKIRVKLTGLGEISDKLYSFVAQLLANGYHRKIARVVSDKLRDAADKVLAKRDICDRFLL